MNDTIWMWIGAFLLAGILTVLLEKKFIPFLMRIKMGQTILEIGPRWHKSKEGTPTMGGIFFIAAIGISVLAFGLPLALKNGDGTIFKIFVMMLLFGAVGFIDDFVKFVKKRNKGLSAVQKMVFQFAIAALFLISIRSRLTTVLSLPFTDFTLNLGIFYWVFAILLIVFVVNAVNLTDGIDGLAGGITFVSFVFIGCVAWMLGKDDMGVLSASVCGGMIGFLFYNYYPARIFMGDTGSLFLGGAVIGAAFWLNSPLIVCFFGLIFIWEAVSVMLQVFFFKTTGKRIFRMAPFHHHLEMCGWKETKIVAVFCLLTALFSVIAYFAFLI